MKGHAQIELTDVNTGRKQVLEEDNLVTNAVAEALKANLQAFSLWRPYSTATPAGTANDFRRYFGGLFLFDTTLEESVDNIIPPYGAHLVGRGSDIAYDGTDKQLGSYSTAESTVEDGSITMVWNFTTEQANGTIESLALTSFAGGRWGLGSDTYDATVNSLDTIGEDRNSAGNTGEIMGRCGEALYNLTQDIFNGGTITITRTKRALESLGIVGNTSSTITLTLSDSFVSSIKESYTSIKMGFNMDGRYIYGIIGFGGTPAGGNIYIVKIDVENDYSVEEITVTNQTGSALYITDNAQCAVIDGYLYCNSHSQAGTLYAINISDPYDYKKTESGYEAKLYFLGKITDNLIIMDARKALELDTMELKAHYWRPGSYRSMQMSKNKMDIGIIQISGDNYYYENIKNPFYLATINNLASPVTKTAAQTMKVTYTITEV